MAVRLLPLEPLDQSLPTSISKGGDASSARQRRRRSTRKAGVKHLSQSQRESSGLELTSLEDSGSHRTGLKEQDENVREAVDGPAITRSSNGNRSRLQGVWPWEQEEGWGSRGLGVKGEGEVGGITEISIALQIPI